MFDPHFASTYIGSKSDQPRHIAHDYNAHALHTYVHAHMYKFVHIQSLVYKEAHQQRGGGGGGGGDGKPLVCQYLN